MSVSAAPAGWAVVVTLLRGGGKDPRGNPKPETRITRGPVLVGWRSTADPVDRSEVTDDLAVMYDDPGFIYDKTDRFEIPTGPWPDGTWQVDGSPKAWPLGTEIPLKRA